MCIGVSVSIYVCVFAFIIIFVLVFTSVCLPVGLKYIHVCLSLYLFVWGVYKGL